MQKAVLKYLFAFLSFAVSARAFADPSVYNQPGEFVDYNHRGNRSVKSGLSNAMRRKVPYAEPIVVKKDGPGDGGGGGTTIRFHDSQCAISIDRLMLRPELADNLDLVAGRDCFTENKPIAQYAEFEPFSARDEQARKRALEMVDHKLNQLIKSDDRYSVALMLKLRMALQNMVLVRTRHIFNILDRIYLSPSMYNRELLINTAILFLPRYGALVMSEIWDAADPETRAHLLIHEAFRELQVALFPSSMDDRVLQLLTSSVIEETDTSPYILMTILQMNVSIVQWIVQTARELPTPLRLNEFELKDASAQTHRAILAAQQKDSDVWLSAEKANERNELVRSLKKSKVFLE